MWWGVSPCVWFRRGPWEVAVLHLYRLTLDLVGLRRFAVWLWSSSRCFLFSCATFRTSPWRSFCQFPCLLRVPASYLPWVQFLGLLTRRVTGWTLCPPPRSSRILSRQSDPGASCDRLSVVVSLSPSLTNALTPCHCGPIGGLSSWLAPYFIPPWAVRLSLPALDACCA